MVAILAVLIRSVAGPAARFAGVLATFVSSMLSCTVRIEVGLELKPLI
jgi:hypothetical protein